VRNGALAEGVHWAVWESCGGAEAGHWGGMVGFVSASAGWQCAAVRLVRGVHWAYGKWQLRGCRGRRWVAWGGIQCERCVGWRGLCNGAIA
jgi:hypothetical protein